MSTRNTSGISLRPIIPYFTGRFFRGTPSQALRARLRSVLSLRDALADISQQHQASRFSNIGRDQILNTSTADKSPAYFLVVPPGHRVSAEMSKPQAQPGGLR